MMKMTRINQIWQELEQDNSVTHGLIFRRYAGSILPDVYVALQNPEKIRCLVTSVSRSYDIDINQFANLRDIDIQIKSDDTKPEKKLVLFRLVNSEHNDIFSVLCEDMLAAISQVTDEVLLMRELLNRFEKWRSLFDTARLAGLTPEEQRGLYGELHFLRNILNFGTGFPFLDIVNSWTGPNRTFRDFQNAQWALEVKTSIGKNHQHVQISSERQLDTLNLELLILYHLSLEIRVQSGETLNQLVDSIVEILRGDAVSLSRFRSKLLEGGYFDNHRSLYDGAGYIVRVTNYYEIEGTFPRIEEADLRDGVGDVKYSIILSACSDYLIDESIAISKLTF